MSILEFKVNEKKVDDFEERLTELRFKIGGLKIISSSRDRIKNLRADLDKLKLNFQSLIETNLPNLDKNRLRQMFEDLIEEFNEIESGDPGED